MKRLDGRPRKKSRRKSARTGKPTEIRRKQANNFKPATTNGTPRPKHTINTINKEKPWKIYQTMQQLSSPAVMCARLRSNKRFKPGY